MDRSLPDHISEHYQLQHYTATCCERKRSLAPLPTDQSSQFLNEQCQPALLSTDVPYGVPRRWDNLECTNAYRYILHSKLSTMHILTCDANDDSDAVQGLVDSYVVQLNDAMHDALTEAVCKHCNKRKTYWCPELSHLRDRKRFRWQLWNAMIDLVPGPCTKRTNISKRCSDIELGSA
ncbi:hypothetical protein NP493_994g00005 [Ridgeia piscesae]|uniref:Uncharacterized protein n=1 Tax=Ridgeia piscesae TaxID=27915 RepID=A0AAD9KK92_RIDPI|nr:hypothetical protein NP493_994g00005 [Ridgeia piscesae]